MSEPTGAGRAHDSVDLTAALVAIDSVNPSLEPGAAGEREAAAFIAGWAEESGLEADVVEATAGRPSVLVRARGSGGGRTLLLCGHIDTVGVAGMDAPHEPRLDGDRLHGRGAYDMKAGVAAALVACREAAARDLAGDVVVAAVADEEYASLGVQEALRHVKADAAIVTEPTQLEIVIAHKGFAWIDVEVDGRAAHGSRPDLGVDAIVKAARVVDAFGALDGSLGTRTHPLLGRGSVHASLIEGGRDLATYPDRCRVQLERRTLPGEDGASVEGEVSALIERCRAADPELVARSSVTLVREPFEVAEDEAIVGIVRSTAAERLGAAPPLVGASFWADSAFIASAGIPTVLFGPGGEGAHAAEEWVSAGDTRACAEILADVAMAVCAG